MHLRSADIDERMDCSQNMLTISKRGLVIAIMACQTEPSALLQIGISDNQKRDRKVSNAMTYQMASNAVYRSPD